MAQWLLSPARGFQPACVAAREGAGEVYVASRSAANGPEIAATPASRLAWPEWVTRSSVREARRRGPERQCVAIDIGINSAWSDSRGDARGVRRDAVKVGGRP